MYVQSSSSLSELESEPSFSVPPASSSSSSSSCMYIYISMYVCMRVVYVMYTYGVSSKQADRDRVVVVVPLAPDVVQLDAGLLHLFEVAHVLHQRDLRAVARHRQRVDVALHVYCSCDRHTDTSHLYIYHSLTVYNAYITRVYNARTYTRVVVGVQSLEAGVELRTLLGVLVRAHGVQRAARGTEDHLKITMKDVRRSYIYTNISSTLTLLCVVVTSLTSDLSSVGTVRSRWNVLRSHTSVFDMTCK